MHFRQKQFAQKRRLRINMQKQFFFFNRKESFCKVILPRICNMNDVFLNEVPCKKKVRMLLLHFEYPLGIWANRKKKMKISFLAPQSFAKVFRVILLFSFAILFGFFSRQLGHKDNAKLVSFSIESIFGFLSKYLLKISIYGGYLDM